MPDKNLLIVGRLSCERTVQVTRNKKVFFYPADSEHAVRVTFNERIPFRNWSLSETGEEGEPLIGRVLPYASGDYRYTVESIYVGTERKRERPRANPQLIVDGGEHVSSSHKGTKRRRKTAARKK